MSPSPDRTVEIPFDPDSEDAVIGIVVASPAGAEEAAQHLIPEDFYRPEWRRVMEVSLQIPLLTEEQRRIDSVVSLASVSHTHLEEIVVYRPWPSDPGGILARKIKAASRRRRVMALAAQIYNGGAFEAPEELGALAHDILEELDALPPPPPPDATAPAASHTIGYYRRQREATQA